MGIFKGASTAGRASGQLSTPDIKKQISGPIPIDDEFPIRNPGTGIAHEGPSDPSEAQPEPDSTAVAEDTDGNTPSVGAREDQTESVAQEDPGQSGPSQASASHATPSPQRRRTSPQRLRRPSPPRSRRLERPSTVRYSTVSERTDVDRSRPQRKKSTLKSALGKLFGRGKKPKGSRQASISEVHIDNQEDHHRSDPAALHRALPNDDEPKRSASLPITEFDRALRSHSVGPDDIIAINSARNSLQVDSEAFRRRVVATAVGRNLSGRAGEFGGELVGLTPRPASAQARDSRLIEDEDPENIGRAISSNDFTLRRRSRSLSQLPDIVGEQTLARNRSQEIRYWRESYHPDELSPNLSASNAEDDFAVVETETPGEITGEPQPKSPVQPFNFDNMFNMKITEAASIEDRMAALELRNQKLEKLVAKLFAVVPGIENYRDSSVRDVPVPPVPTQPAAPYLATSSAAASQAMYPTDSHDLEARPRYSLSRRSIESFGDGNTYIGSIPTSTRPAVRPISNATIRGATSLPTLPREGSGGFTVDHYVTLKALLDTERAARQALESQVTKLGHRINLMARAQKLDIDPESSAYSNVSMFEHDDDDDDEEPMTAGADSESDAFKTPREEGPAHPFGAFGEELRVEEDDGSRKKAARTLSLSQLTLGKPKATPASANVGL
ncbi:hypothetical protein F4780DRAFT_210309 [Xylariomycetidae sp. FL0641]|nr:hypothetical protein F4780DRAFT_210309 [Xylariomycetidae sp. FL0641]